MCIIWLSDEIEFGHATHFTYYIFGKYAYSDIATDLFQTKQDEWITESIQHQSFKISKRNADSFWNAATVFLGDVQTLIHMKPFSLARQK